MFKISQWTANCEKQSLSWAVTIFCDNWFCLCSCISVLLFIPYFLQFLAQKSSLLLIILSLRESSFNMTRGDEDFEFGLQKFLDTWKGGSEKIVGLGGGGLWKSVYFKTNNNTLTIASVKCKNCEFLSRQKLRVYFCVNYLYSNE